MPTAHQGLRVMVFDDYNLGTLEDDLSHRYTSLAFGTSLHGGFKDCKITVPMSLEEIWLYLARENLPGRHFHHVRITEDRRMIWEGRIMDCGFSISSRSHNLELTVMGYWSSCRDQKYDPADAGNTDWTGSGPHNIDDIIKEMLTKSCPDINADQAGVDAQTQDVVGIDLTTRAYPMDNIVDKLVPLSDAISHFAIWDDRKAYLTARSVAQVDILIWLAATENLRLVQQGKHLRNRILPVVGTAEGTTATDADSQVLYPRRDLTLTLPSGVPTTAVNNARDDILAERANPRQQTSFAVSGRIYSASLTSIATATGALQEIPKWRVRAGDVIRIQDLVPSSVASPKLDDLRTFHILETRYDAIANRLTIQPDRPTVSLSSLLFRANQLERDKG